MNFANEAALIRKRFGTLFEDTHPTVLCVYDNQDAAIPDPTGSFVRLRIDWNAAALAGLGSPRLFRDLGALAIQIFVPQGSGEDTLLSLADDIATIFHSVTVQDSGTEVRFLKPRMQRIGSEGDFYQANIIARFQSDFTGT